MQIVGADGTNTKLYGNKIEAYNVFVSNDLYVPNEIYHTGDTNTFIQFPGADQFRINTGGGNRLQVQNDKILVGDDVNMQYDGISTGNSGTVVYGGFLNPASEANMVHIPHIINDLAGFNKWSNATITTSGFYQTRSGSAGSYTYSNEVSSSTAGWANAFDAHSSTAGSWYSDNGSDGVYTHGTDTPGVVELQWTNEATYSLWAGIVFGSGSFTATYVKIEAYRGGAWQTLCEITNNTDQVILRQVANNSGTGAATTRLKYTLGGSVNNSYFRIHSLYMANYRAGDNNLNNTSIDSTRGVNFLERYKNNYAHGHFYPGANSTYDIGSSSYKWNNVNAVTLNGNLVGTIHSNTTANTQSQGNNSTKVATTAYVDTAVTNLVDSAPGTLNTLNELAAALGDDANFSTTVTNSIAGKVSKSGDTMTGSLTIGSAGSGHDVKFFGDLSGEYFMWDENVSTVNIYHRDELPGLEVYVNAGGQTTQPQLKVGRSNTQYWGAYVDDRNAHLVHRQDETSGIMTTRFDQWDSNTSDNTGQWQWRSGDGTGASMTTAAVLYQDGDFTVKGDLMPITDGGGSLGKGTGTNLRWSGLELQSGAGIQWQNGDARIVEGLVNNYSLSFQTYDGSTLSTALRLDGDNNANFAGRVGIGTDPASGMKLHVNGEVRVDATEGVATRKIRAGYFSSTTDIRVEAGSAGDVILGDSSAARLTLASDDTATFAGNLRTPASGKLFLWTGHDSNFLQYNLWQASASGGMTIKNIASGGDIIFQTNSNTALTIDSSQNSTFAGHAILNSGKYLEFSGQGKLINMDVTAWSNASEHNLLYAGWESSLGDYLSLKVPGNGTTNHGNLIIGDNGLWFGRANTTDSAQATNSNTNPHPGSGSNYFRVNTSGALQVSGSVISPIFYDTNTSYYVDPAGTSQVNKFRLNTTSDLQTGSSKLDVSGISAMRSNSTTSAVLYLQNHDSTTNTIQPYLFLSDGGGNRGGLGVETSTSIMSVNGQGGLKFQTGASGVGGTEAILIDNSQNIKFNGAYIFPKTMGSAGQVLKVPSSGTTLEWGSVSGGGDIDGSGSANRLAIWSDSDTLTSNVNITVSSGQLNLGNGLLVEDNDTTVITAKAYEPHIVWQKTRGSSGDDFFKIKAENDAMAVDFTTARDDSDTRVLRIDANNNFVFSTNGAHTQLHSSFMSVYGRLTSSSDIRSTQYYDYNDTTKYIDLNNTGTSLVANGTATFGGTGTSSFGGDLRLESGTSGTTAKLIFKRTDNNSVATFIRTNSYWNEYSSHQNEGHKFVDSNSSGTVQNILLQLNGDNSTTKMVRCQQLLQVISMVNL